MVYKNNLVLVVLSLALLSLPVPAQSFKEQQLKHSRVAAARAGKEAVIRELFRQKGLSYPPQAIFLRVFKLEGLLEVWVGRGEGKFALLKQYRVCASSGQLGPKRREGDGQVPEGFYAISGFNPVSNFHLSLKVNYPNQSDRILGRGPRLGGDIFIHGDCVTIGCVPLTDDKIKEVYWLAVEARSAGQQQIPVHIFPARLDETGLARLKRESGGDEALWDFWSNLKGGFDYFEKHHRPPTITVDREGKYRVAG